MEFLLRREKNCVMKDDRRNTLKFSCAGNIIYDDRVIFMVSAMLRDWYFSSQKLQIIDIWMMNTAFDSSGSFGSRV